MEFLIAIAIIVALNELKEWRAHQRNQEFVATIAELNQRSDEESAGVAKLHDQIEALTAAVSSMNDELGAAQEFINKAHSDLATIVEEYKLNGTPLGYIRKPEYQADFIEGV